MGVALLLLIAFGGFFLLATLPGKSKTLDRPAMVEDSRRSWLLDCAKQRSLTECKIDWEELNAE